MAVLFTIADLFWTNRWRVITTNPAGSFTDFLRQIQPHRTAKTDLLIYSDTTRCQTEGRFDS